MIHLDRSDLADGLDIAAGNELIDFLADQVREEAGDGPAAVRLGNRKLLGKGLAYVHHTIIVGVARDLAVAIGVNEDGDAGKWSVIGRDPIAGQVEVLMAGNGE